MEWPIIAAAISVLSMLLVGTAIFLWNTWSFVPLSGLVTFLYTMSINPIGRYFRLLMSVISVWVALIIHNSIDFGIRLTNSSYAWLKTGQISWYIHFILFALVVIFTIADILIRTPSDSNLKSNTKKISIVFIIIISSIVWLFLKINEWHPIPDQLIADQKVTIHRIADFRSSGCDKNGKPTDIAIFNDTVTLERTSNSYIAFALESIGQHVEVFDRSKNENKRVEPTTTWINGSRYNTYAISVDQKNQAKVEYIWKNSHYDADHKEAGMLGITSKSYLSAVSCHILLPDGISLNPDEKPFNNSVEKNCEIGEGNNTFQCKGLKRPEFVLFSFKWNLWSNCQ